MLLWASETKQQNDDWNERIPHGPASGFSGKKSVSENQQNLKN